MDLDDPQRVRANAHALSGRSFDLDHPGILLRAPILPARSYPDGFDLSTIWRGCDPVADALESARTIRRRRPPTHHEEALPCRPARLAASAPGRRAAARH